MRSGTSPRTAGALVGFGGIAVVTAICFPFSDRLPTTVPALLLLVPIIGSSILAEWFIAVPVAAVAGGVYAFTFLEPVGTIRFGLTTDMFVEGTFLGVSVAASIAISQRSKARREALLDSEREMLLRAVSHDLRNPLHTIQTVTADLLEGDLYDERARDKLLHIVADESHRLEQIVKNLSSISRLQAATFERSISPQPIDDIVSVCVDRYRRLGLLSITTDLAPSLPMVMADAVLIDQVLTNLIDNAIKHAAPAVQVEISARRIGHLVEIVVTDDGPGFSPTSRARLFTPQFSEDGRSSLGLTVCKAIVAAHGGTLDIRNAGTRNGAEGGAAIAFTLRTAP